MTSVRCGVTSAHFFKRLRYEVVGEPFPYLWVPEWHKTDHGLHAHFAVGRYLSMTVVDQCGVVASPTSSGSATPAGSFASAQAGAAGYLVEVRGKAFERSRRRRASSLRVAQGFRPKVERDRRCRLVRGASNLRRSGWEPDLCDSVVVGRGLTNGKVHRRCGWRGMTDDPQSAELRTGSVRARCGRSEDRCRARMAGKRHMLTVAYCRVSTEEQAAEGFSIEGQAES